MSDISESRANGRRLDLDGPDNTVVFELPAGYDRRSAPTLVFESPSVVRLVRSYPANWRELSDSELAALRDRR